jgi:MFS family permease
MKKITAPINKVGFLLTMSDSFSWGPLIIISSLTSIYLAKRIGGDIAEFVGIGMGIYYVTRAIFQIPIGKLTDKIKKDKDEILILALGAILMGLPYLFFPIIKTAVGFYITQFVFGIGVSLSVVNWRKIFALNVTYGLEGKEYAFYDTVLSIITAIVCVVFGLIANIGDRYFDIVMVTSGIIMMSASIWILLILNIKDRKSLK